MKQGAIGVITNGKNTSTIDTGSFPTISEDRGYELRSTVEEEWTQQAFDGTTLNKGRAATESTEKIKTTRVTPDGKIEEGQEKTEVATHATDFLRVPGEFVVTRSTKDEFAYRLLKEATGESIHSAVVDLESFVEASPGAQPWMGWFRGNGGPLNAGSAYGDINSAPELANYLERHQNTQLGLQNVEYNGRQLKLVLSRSGWVAVYEPKDMDTIEFARFVREKVRPYAEPNL